MKTLSNVPNEKSDSTGTAFYILSGLIFLSFIGMIGYVLYSFFVE